MAKKKKSPKFNNPYRIPNDDADEIRRLSNDDLLVRMTKEYDNWIRTEKAKKLDAEITKCRREVSDLKKEVKANPQVQDFQAKLDELVDELGGEELATAKEELKNALQPLSEDATRFKGMFKIAMEEFKRRKDIGAFK